MTVEWLVSTYGEGINKVENMLLHPTPGLRYLVSHQNGETPAIVPPALLRPDVKVVTTPGNGLAANRNHALKHATGDLLVLADDDIKLKSSYASHIRQTFRKHPDIDVACFRIRTPGHHIPYKRYSDREQNLRTLRQIRDISSIEIVLRRKSFKHRNIRFDERFGLGRKANSGEEYIFLARCQSKGLKIRYFPVYIVEHPSESSVKSQPPFGDERLFSTGAQAYVLYGEFAYLRNFFAAIRRFTSYRRMGITFAHFLKMKNQGSDYARFTS